MSPTATVSLDTSRLFETSWSAEGIGYCDQPLFLVAAPGPLARVWAQLTR